LLKRIRERIRQHQKKEEKMGCQEKLLS
jgi:hypothetical protein